MNKYKKLLLGILFPNLIFTLIVVPIAATLLIYSFVCKTAHPIIVYFSYFFSAYALTILCTRIPKLINAINRVKTENKYIRRLLNDPKLRVTISLYATLIINLLFAGLQLYLGIVNYSAWFYTLASYYALLSGMRFLLLRNIRTSDKLDANQDYTSRIPGMSKYGNADRRRLIELSKYRLCGIILVIMHTALSAMVFYIVYKNQGFEYNFIVTIAVATFTFTTLTVAIVNVIKYRRYDNPIFSASKAISLATALVSLLALETAMLTAFSETDMPTFRRIITASTGIVVCGTVLAMASYMIIHATKEIDIIKQKSL